MTSTPQVQPDLINDLRRHVRSFADQHQQLNASRSSLQEERDSLALQLKEAKAELDACKETLNHVFPYAAYREKQPDLAEFNDLELVEHFSKCGIHEGTNLKHDDTIESAVKALRDELVSTKSAYLNVFPYFQYKAKRKDLDHMSDLELANHYRTMGINEGTHIIEQ